LSSSGFWGFGVGGCWGFQFLMFVFGVLVLVGIGVL